MKTVVKFLIVLLVWLPYKMSAFAKDSSFGQDLVVALVAFGLAYLVTGVIWGAAHKPRHDDPDRKQRKDG